MPEHTCATCKHHCPDDSDWVCINRDSERFATWTEKGDTCPYWEEEE
jgi:hypothetical protein